MSYRGKMKNFFICTRQKARGGGKKGPGIMEKGTIEEERPGRPVLKCLGKTSRGKSI